MMKSKWYYMHTIDEKPAAYDGEQICFLGSWNVFAVACESLKEIRKQAAASARWRQERGLTDEGFRYSYVKFKLPEAK